RKRHHGCRQQRSDTENQLALVMNAIRLRIALVLFCSVIVLAPLPFGSVDEVVVALWAVLLGVATVLCVPFNPSRQQIAVLLSAFAVASAWGVVLHEQTSAAPWFSGSLADPIWAEVSPLLDATLPRTVTVVRDLPLFAAGPQMVAFLSLLCGFLLGSNR